MGIWNSTLVYVGARTLLAGAIIALLLRRRVGVAYVGGQIVSDLSCAAFLLAYVHPDIRDDVGWIVVPLILFVLYWEATRFLHAARASAEREADESWLDNLLRIYGSVWVVGLVTPALLAGGFLVFDLLAPRQWPFPNPRPGLVCAPQQLHPAAELILRMTAPHGTQVTVFPPKGRPVVLIPYGSKAFRDVETLTLAMDTLQQVFSDSGVYALTVSSEWEVTASEMCRVRYAGAASG